LAWILSWLRWTRTCPKGHSLRSAYRRNVIAVQLPRPASNSS
jgi:hypothetical protein